MHAEAAAQCGRCAFCVAGCPVFSATLRQGLGPRAKVFLINRLRTGEAELSPDLAAAFYLCTHCGQCAATCPSKVPVLDLVFHGRRLAAEKGLAPDGLHLAMESMARNGNPFAEPREKRSDLWPDGLPAPGAGTSLYWAGCMASYQDVRVIPATMRLFRAAGEPVAALGGGEGCCGYLAWLAGEDATFRDLAAANQPLLSVPDRIITTCAGCQATFGRLYPDHGVAIAPALHFTEWLAQTLARGGLPLKEGMDPVRVIWHDPCDLGRHLGIYEPPRQALAALPGVELLEFPTNRAAAQCCGGGGGVKAVDAELSLVMAENRVLQAAERAAEVIVSACPSCKQNLTQAASRLKRQGRLERRIKVQDITEFATARLADGKKA